VATLTTSANHSFVPGQSIIVANVSSTFNGTYTITGVTANTISYSQALSDVIETAETGGTATATYPSYGSYKLLSYLGASVVTNPFRGQYTGLARNQANQKWYLVGGIANKPSDTIDFSVPGTTFTREDLNVDTLEARNVILDKDPWDPSHAVDYSTFNLTPSIITGNTALVAKRYGNVTEGYVHATGNYFVVPASGMVLTLPASPLIGDTLIITDIAGTAGSVSTKPVIARNGQLIQGKAEDMTFDVSNASLKLVYSNTTYGWRITQ
jgi:hypothetical protein